eukprot:2781111-Pyramimonas_sp.AAC.2
MQTFLEGTAALGGPVSPPPTPFGPPSDPSHSPRAASGGDGGGGAPATQARAAPYSEGDPRQRHTHGPGEPFSPPSDLFSMQPLPLYLPPLRRTFDRYAPGGARKTSASPEALGRFQLQRCRAFRASVMLRAVRAIKRNGAPSRRDERANVFAPGYDAGAHECVRIRGVPPLQV